ncbi:hypothetical protein Hanom_Chr12g01112051 [Helianthus anomalus]
MFNLIVFSEIHGLSFIFVPNFKRCSLSLKLMIFILNVLKSCMLCSLTLTQLDFFLLN